MNFRCADYQAGIPEYIVSKSYTLIMVTARG